MVEIKNETDIETYLKGVVERITDIKSFEFVDVDDDLTELVAGHMKNRYKGPVVFFGMYEQKVSLSSSLTFCSPQCQLTVLAKYAKNDRASLLAVREKTRIWITKIINEIQKDFEETRDGSYLSPDPAGGQHWNFKLHNNLILPVGDIANSGTRGWSIDFEIGFPVTETRI